MKFLINRRSFCFFVFFYFLFLWYFLGQPKISQNPPIPPDSSPVLADTASLVVTACDNEDVASTPCYDAIVADIGTSWSFTKGIHLDAPFQTLSSVSSVTSATLYYDSSGIVSGTWAVYVKDARDGNIICSVDPAPEDASETRNSLDCSSVTPGQLGAGVWFQADNNDGAGPEPMYLDYVYLDIGYTAAAAVSISLVSPVTSGSLAFTTLALGTTKDTTSAGINDTEIVSVDSGPADLDIKSTDFTEGGNTWFLNSGNGTTQVQWQFSKNAGVGWTTFVADETLYGLEGNVAQGDTRLVDFELTMPTTTDSYNQYGSTVTIVASSP